MFRLIIECLDWRSVCEASEPCSIVGVDEVDEVFLPIGGGCEAIFAAICSAGWRLGDGCCQPPVEAFDHAVGLGMEGLGQSMIDTPLSAELIEGMVA